MFDPPPNSNKTELICLEASTAQAMVDSLVGQLRALHGIESDPWISKEEAMRLLRITSDETLSKYCKEGTIIRSKMGNKSILYYRESILAFIEKHIENPNDGNK